MSDTLQQSAERLAVYAWSIDGLASLPPDTQQQIKVCAEWHHRGLAAERTRADGLEQECKAWEESTRDAHNAIHRAEQAEARLVECLEYIEHRRSKFSPQRALTTCEHGEQNWLDRLSSTEPPKILAEVCDLRETVWVVARMLSALTKQPATKPLHDLATDAADLVRTERQRADSAEQERDKLKAQLQTAKDAELKRRGQRYEKQSTRPSPPQGRQSVEGISATLRRQRTEQAMNTEQPTDDTERRLKEIREVTDAEHLLHNAKHFHVSDDDYGACITGLITIIERLQVEQRKLADTVIGWSRLVERDGQLRAIEELRGTHDCGCEICSQTSTLCPATASSYALRIIELQDQLDQEKKWKIEDPRMLREQIRVDDVAFNGLNKRHNAALAEIETIKDANRRANAAIGDIANECKGYVTQLERGHGAFPECPWPETVWTMTMEQYVKATPDENIRTRISGFLMREGWKLAVKEITPFITQLQAQLAECQAARARLSDPVVDPRNSEELNDK